MRDLIELAARVEAADASEQRLMLAEVFNALFPQPEQANEPEWQGPGTLREPLYHVWFVRKCRFTTMLDAEAYESAALMLVPDGWRCYTADMSIKGRVRWMLEGPKTKWGIDEHGDRCAGNDWYMQSVATTPALALTAACLRAIAGGCDEHLRPL